jgi:hypothetical protein
MKWILGLSFTLLTSASLADTTNYEAKGNLEAPNPASCVGMEKLTNKQNPADIFVGINECLSKKDYEKASYLFFAALAYGKYDTLRVKDKSAHQAISVLRMNSFSQLSEIEVTELQKSFGALMNDESQKKKLCDGLQTLGIPDYSPKYMMQHGMSAFTGQGGGLIKDFDSAQSWDKVKVEFAKCTV